MIVFLFGCFASFSKRKKIIEYGVRPPVSTRRKKGLSCLYIFIFFKKFVIFLITAEARQKIVFLWMSCILQQKRGKKLNMGCPPSPQGVIKELKPPHIEEKIKEFVFFFIFIFFFNQIFVCLFGIGASVSTPKETISSNNWKVFVIYFLFMFEVGIVNLGERKYMNGKKREKEKNEKKDPKIFEKRKKMIEKGKKKIKKRKKKKKKKKKKKRKKRKKRI
ncbi:hypothetical protein RFI_25827 [Reticulomyxa filosa]|uniref:Uncharacterized protein n=1 Tax=Reticulomyxa filosa TaxID=46433 RepID=X6MCF7_RETFI|nr:hypothetical protein RFI_25827 [Reticulomyxa filosa]|eukprot:ETO11549.1 hypothetical protein RFI_25827 [Reticulomyxa filosa]